MRAARQQAIPDLFEARHAAAAQVVHGRMAVVDFEDLVVARAPQIVGGQRPAEVRMVDVRHARRGANAVDVALQRLADRGAVVGLDQRLDVETVDVDRLVAGARGHLLAADDQKLLVGAVDRVEAVDVGEEVVIGQHQELIAVRRDTSARLHPACCRRRC